MKKTLKAGCFTYTVYFQPTDSDHGATCLDTKKIIVDNTKSLQCQRETLQHEILHVCSEDIAALKMEKFEGDREEDTIRFQSPRFMQILRDNKWAREFMYE